MVTSCTEKKEEKLIPEKDFISIVTESYLADGLMTIPSIRDLYSKRDTTAIYNDIIKSHGYTWEEMQNTLDKYFTGDPKGLSKLFDQVLGKLSEMEAEATLENQKKLDAEAAKIKTKYHFVLPDSAVREKPGFSYEFLGPGTFTLTFSVRLFPTDESLDPCFTGLIRPANAKKEDKIILLRNISYIKDGMTHEYTVSGKIDKEGPAVLTGFYLNSRNNPPWVGHYAEIHNLAYSFLSIPR